MAFLTVEVEEVFQIVEAEVAFLTVEVEEVFQIVEAEEVFQVCVLITICI